VPVYVEYAKALSSGFGGATTAEVAQFSIFVISVLLVILPTALMDNLFRGKNKGLAFASPIFAFSLISLLVMWLSIEEFVYTLSFTGFGGSVSIFMFVIQFVFASALWATMIALTVQQRKLKLGKK